MTGKLFSSDSMFVLKITLQDVRPCVWRRVAVPKAISLDRLHDVIQIVMGWKDKHLHLFEIDGRRFSEEPEDVDLEGTEETGRRLDELCRGAGTVIQYLYDYGDNWKHVIEVESESLPDRSFVEVIHCLGGEGACPPEDSGGPYIYNDQSAKDLASQGDSGMLAGQGAFSEFVINNELRKYLRWTRDRSFSDDG